MTAALTVVGPHSHLVDEDDRALAERSRDGDVDAFALLYRRYVERVYAFARRRTGSDARAEDVTAATFERAWRALPTFEWRGRGFEPWLFRIAANELTGQHRRERRLTAVGDLAEPIDPSEPADDAVRHETQEELRQALGQLPHRYQVALSLRYLTGLSTAEAAEALGCSPAALAVTVHRARRALARILEEGSK